MENERIPEGEGLQPPLQKSPKAQIELGPCLMGGALMAILSVFPLISVFNVFCCLWLIVGGAVTILIAKRNNPEPITGGDALLYGAISGVFGWLLFTVFQLIRALVFGQRLNRIQKELFDKLAFPEAQSVMDWVNRVGFVRITLLGCALAFAFFLFFPPLGAALVRLIEKRKGRN
mgnify:FL=1